MDVARNLIASNLLSGGDGSQFSAQLTFLKSSVGKEVIDEVHHSDDENDDDDDDDDDDDEDEADDNEGEKEVEEVSCQCGKSSKHPNKLMECKIKVIKERMKDKTERSTIQHFFRDECIVS